MNLELVFILQVKDKIKVKCEKDVYKILKKSVFKNVYKVYSPILKGFPDFIVIETFVKDLEAGFYEVKYDKIKLTKNQKSVITNLAKSFNVYLTVYDKKGHSIKFYKITLDNN